MKGKKERERKEGERVTKQEKEDKRRGEKKERAFEMLAAPRRYEHKGFCHSGVCDSKSACTSVCTYMLFKLRMLVLVKNCVELTDSIV